MLLLKLVQKIPHPVLDDQHFSFDVRCLRDALNSDGHIAACGLGDPPPNKLPLEVQNLSELVAIANRIHVPGKP